MKKYSWLIIILVVVGIGWVANRQGPNNDDGQIENQDVVTHDFNFIIHPDADLPEQDVYVVSEDNEDQVVRLPGDFDLSDPRMDEMVYSALEMVEHDPFQVGENPLGPYQKGESLGFTLKDWLSASASGTYEVKGDKASLKVEAKDLVPNGLYTVWCSHIYFPPNPKIVDYPCGATDGSESVVKADDKGSLSYSVSMDSLPAAEETNMPILALNYHSDGKTYEENPGPFGQGAHIQLFYMLPPL